MDGMGVLLTSKVNISLPWELRQPVEAYFIATLLKGRHISAFQDDVILQIYSIVYNEMHVYVYCVCIYICIYIYMCFQYVHMYINCICT